MKIVIQKVKSANVVVDNQIEGKIEQGYLLLVGIEETDTIEDINRAADKIFNIRLFEDVDDKINLSISDVGGAVLSISQFTLAADIRKGNRPSFSKAMRQEEANRLYELFNERLRNHGLTVETGVFQTHMNVNLDNDGPVTIIMEVKDGKVQ